MKELDQTDLKILAFLQKDARMTNKELAARLDLSITPVFERIKKLERKGYIQKYTAVLDAEKVNRGLIVFLTIRMAQHRKDLIQKLEEMVKNLPEIMECYHLAGEDDYLLKVMVKDMQAYQQFVVNKLISIENVGHVNSHFVMSVVKSETELFLG